MPDMLNWQRRAECVRANPQLFDHPNSDGRLTIAERAHVDDVITRHCDRCLVRVQCFTQALTDDRDGIAGGQLITHRHGTLAGYNRYHRLGRREGRDACPPCQAAKNAYYRDYRQHARAGAAA